MTKEKKERIATAIAARLTGGRFPFKNGDRVRIVESPAERARTAQLNSLLGKSGTVRGSPMYIFSFPIEFDEPQEFLHSCDGCTARKRGWYVLIENLQIIFDQDDNDD